MSELRIGTCSWKYPSWHRLVYSAPKGINYLEEYAQQYNTVEIDQWFWSLFGADQVKLPNPFDVVAYRAAVNDDFRFTVKVPNSITLTHFYKKARAGPLIPNPHFLSPTLFQEFLALLDPLRGVLGPLMFQFEYLNRQKMGAQQQFQVLFETFLERVPASYKYAIETRNTNYLNASHFEFLARSKLIPVLLQGYWMPSITEVFGKWRPSILQQEDVVIRLHGSGRKEMEKLTGKRWDRAIAPKDGELTSVADMIQDLLDQGINVYLNVNNHYEGSAPVTIARMRQLL